MLQLQLQLINNVPDLDCSSASSARVRASARASTGSDINAPRTHTHTHTSAAPPSHHRANYCYCRPGLPAASQRSSLSRRVGTTATQYTAGYRLICSRTPVLYPSLHYTIPYTGCIPPVPYSCSTSGSSRPRSPAADPSSAQTPPSPVFSSVRRRAYTG